MMWQLKGLRITFKPLSQMSNVSLMEICRFYGPGPQGGDLHAPLSPILVIFLALKGVKGTLHQLSYMKEVNML